MILVVFSCQRLASLPVYHEEAGQPSALDLTLGPHHRFAFRLIRIGLCVLADNALVTRDHRPVMPRYEQNGTSR